MTKMKIINLHLTCQISVFVPTVLIINTFLYNFSISLVTQTFKFLSKLFMCRMKNDFTALPFLLSSSQKKKKKKKICSKKPLSHLNHHWSTVSLLSSWCTSLHSFYSCSIFSRGLTSKVFYSHPETVILRHKEDQILLADVSGC